MNKVKPISPKEIIERKQDSIPDEIFQAVNEMITKNWNGHSSTFRQSDLVDHYFSIVGGGELNSDREKIYENHWLDFEDIYRKAGWSVEYDRPGYNESYPATFTFKKKNSKV
mgnify:CR=1 FL=1|jgi:hypothetical protein